jgi:16S rRNA (guanine527-N7)-methyltransferase
VERYAGRLNLVAGDDLDRFYERHVADSLRLLDLLGDGPCVDVGSGAGLPGIPLAIAGPARRWHLLEPRRQRAAFLEEVVRELGLANVEVLPLRAEEAALDPGLRGAHQAATARALASPARAVGLLRPLVAPGGIVAVFVGERAEIPPEAEVPSEGIAIVRVD